VLLLIEGWRTSPAAAALAVTILPLAAGAAGRAGRGLDPVARAGAGAVLVGAGLAALGLLPGAGIGWTVAPQVVVGAGLGLSIGALTGAALAGGGPPGLPAGWTIGARHAGLVAGLLILTPVFSADLDRQQDAAELAGLAVLLDAELALPAKVALARDLAERVAQADGRLPRLGPAFDAAQARGDPAQLARVRADLEDQLDRAGTAAFSPSFIAATMFALLALGALLVARPRGRA
jgi:hypothetical protein